MGKWKKIYEKQKINNKDKIRIGDYVFLVKFETINFEYKEK